MKTDRELLVELFDFLKNRSFIMGDKEGVRDMALRYKQPPLTMYYRIAMKMTIDDYNQLAALMNRIDEHLNAAIKSKYAVVTDETA